MLFRITNILVLSSFILINSNLFFYQHYCGDELYASTFFHTKACACGDEMLVDTIQWIRIQDDGCCVEKLFFAHTDSAFLSHHRIISIFGILLALITFVYTPLYTDIFVFLLFYKFLKRRTESVALYLHNVLIRSVVLRN